MQAMNVQLSLEETYADITPVRPNVEVTESEISFISVRTFKMLKQLWGHIQIRSNQFL